MNTPTTPKCDRCERPATVVVGSRWLCTEHYPPTGCAESKLAKHERRVVGHVSGWQEQMNECVCGKPWPCAESKPEGVRVPPGFDIPFTSGNPVEASAGVVRAPARNPAHENTCVCGECCCCRRDAEYRELLAAREEIARLRGVLDPQTERKR